MKIDKKCSTDWSHRTRIVGAVFIVLATILTLLTLNGLGILGMFAVGCMMCHHNRWSCCNCPCCYSGECKDTDDEHHHHAECENTGKHKKKED